MITVVSKLYVGLIFRYLIVNWDDFMLFVRDYLKNGGSYEPPNR